MFQLSFLKDLFTLHGSGIVPYLPYLVTALFLGLFLAWTYLTLTRFIEAGILKKLHTLGAKDKDTAVSLDALGFVKDGKLHPFYKWFLSAPSCSIYHTVSCDTLDNRTLEDFQVRKRKNDSTDAPVTSQTASPFDAGEETLPCNQDVNGRGCTPSVVGEDTSLGATAPLVSDILTDTTEKKRHTKQKYPSIRIPLSPDTKFYILKERLAYVEERGMHFTADHWMQLVYTFLACGFACFLVLWFLEDLVRLF